MHGRNTCRPHSTNRDAEQDLGIQYHNGNNAISETLDPFCYVRRAFFFAPEGYAFIPARYATLEGSPISGLAFYISQLLSLALLTANKKAAFVSVTLK